MLELWEDHTRWLIDGLRNHRLDAALLATPPDAPEISELLLFKEPLLAALPQNHKLAKAAKVDEKRWRMSCWCWPTAIAWPARRWRPAARDAQRTGIAASMQASTLDTLVNLVAAGYGTTLIPALAADSFRKRDIVLRPLVGASSRTIRLASRPGFPRPQALRALEKVIRKAVGARLT